MSQEIYCIAPTQDRARQVVAKIKEMGIRFGNISVIDERSEIERVAHPESEEFRNALNGSIIGAVIGCDQRQNRRRACRKTFRAWLCLCAPPRDYARSP